MFGMRVDVAKRGFFDRQFVLNATSRAERKVLSRAGAFIRRRAQTSIKPAPRVSVATGQVLRGRRRKGVVYRDATSKPGQPPYSHGQRLLRKYIMFSYDSQRRSVVVGPTKLNQVGNAPEALEKGGLTVVLTGRGRRRRTVVLAPRPYMAPALQAELPAISQLWRDSIK